MNLKKYALILMTSLSGLICQGQDISNAAENFRASIYDFLQEEGFFPSIDENRDLVFKKEGIPYYISILEEKPIYVIFTRDAIATQDADRLVVLNAINEINSGVRALKCSYIENYVRMGIESYCYTAEDFKYVFYRYLGILEASDNLVKRTYALYCNELDSIQALEVEKGKMDLLANQLEGAEVWKSIQNSTSVSEMERFIKAYPFAIEVSLAMNRIHELKGTLYYEIDALDEAYSELINLERTQVSSENLAVYDAVMEYHDYSILNKESTESDLRMYMVKYPDGLYVDQVTHLYLKKQKERRTAERAKRRKQNGGWFNLGLQFLDLGIHGFKGDLICYYNAGLKLRVGNLLDRVQFSIGIKPGVLIYPDYVYMPELDETEKNIYVPFHLPIETQLNFNLFKISPDSRLFVFGGYQYNAIKAAEMENAMSWSAGMGTMWRHLEWDIYYRKEIGSSKTDLMKNAQYFGTTLTYYWQL